MVKKGWFERQGFFAKTLILIGVILLAVLSSRDSFITSTDTIPSPVATVSPTPKSTPVVATPKTKVASPTPKITQIPVSTNRLLFLVNQERVKAGKKPLIELKSLDAGATNRAKFIVESGQWSHEGYAESIRAVLQNKNAGVGENLARFYNSPDGVIVGWLNSPIHKEVMLKSFSYAGIGQYQDYWVLWMSTTP